jgi:Sulfotransferase family
MSRADIEMGAAAKSFRSRSSSPIPAPHSTAAPASQQSRAATNLPDVFVVGAAKCGTTALYHYFRAHPQVFVPSAIKETNYMAFYDGLPPLAGPGDKIALAGQSITRLADYEALYNQRTKEIAAADVSPAYLYCPQAAPKIAELCPQAKIIIILRNPVECAFSMYSMMRRDLREPCKKFWTAFEQSRARMAAGWEWAWDYQRGAMFADQVERFQKLFPTKQLFIRRYSDLKNDPKSYYRDLNKFLGIGSIDVTAANRQVNLSPTRRDMIAKRTAGRWFLRACRVGGLMLPPSVKKTIWQKTVGRPAFVLSPEDRHRLIAHFEADIRRLGKLLAWDISEWLRA